MGRSGAGTRFAGRAIVAAALALVLAGVAAPTAEARGRGWDGRGPSPDRQAARLAERLGLSAEQEVQVRQVLAESAGKRREIREDGWKKMESLRAETEKRLSGVLTPQQMAEFRSVREERRNRRRDCGPRPEDPEGRFPGAPPPDRN